MRFGRGVLSNRVPIGSRHRQQLNGDFVAALLRDFRCCGPKAIERVRRPRPAAYLKVLALLVPREHKVEHTNAIGQLTDEQLEAMIEELTERIAAKAAGLGAKVIEGEAVETTAVSTTTPLVLEPRDGVCPTWGVCSLAAWSAREIELQALQSAAHFLKSHQLLVQKFAADRDRQKNRVLISQRGHQLNVPFEARDGGLGHVPGGVAASAAAELGLHPLDAPTGIAGGGGAPRFRFAQL